MTPQLIDRIMLILAGSRDEIISLQKKVISLSVSPAAPAEELSRSQGDLLSLVEAFNTMPQVEAKEEAEAISQLEAALTVWEKILAL